MNIRSVPLVTPWLHRTLCALHPACGCLAVAGGRSRCWATAWAGYFAAAKVDAFHAPKPPCRRRTFSNPAKRNAIADWAANEPVLQ